MTTIEKIALQEFNIKYKYLGDNEKQWCHDEMVNNPKWLAPFHHDTTVFHCHQDIYP